MLTDCVKICVKIILGFIVHANALQLGSPVVQITSFSTMLKQDGSLTVDPGKKKRKKKAK